MHQRVSNARKVAARVDRSLARLHAMRALPGKTGRQKLAPDHRACGPGLLAALPFERAGAKRHPVGWRPDQVVLSVRWRLRLWLLRVLRLDVMSRWRRLRRGRNCRRIARQGWPGWRQWRRRGQRLRGRADPRAGKPKSTRNGARHAAAIDPQAAAQLARLTRGVRPRRHGVDDKMLRNSQDVSARVWPRSHAIASGTRCGQWRLSAGLSARRASTDRETPCDAD